MYAESFFNPDTFFLFYFFSTVSIFCQVIQKCMFCWVKCSSQIQYKPQICISVHISYPESPHHVNNPQRFKTQHKCTGVHLLHLESSQSRANVELLGACVRRFLAFVTLWIFTFNFIWLLLFWVQVSLNRFFFWVHRFWVDQLIHVVWKSIFLLYW